MKNLIFLSIIVIFATCASKKNTTQNKEIHLLTQLKPMDDTLNTEEINIINNFLDDELKNKLYQIYKEYNIIIIEDAGNGIKSLNTYEYAYKDYHYLNGKDVTQEDNLRLGWILDSLEIKKYREKIVNLKSYTWKITDFKNIKVKLLKFEELRKTTNTGEYLKKNLILFLSRPLLINKHTALLSFEIGNGDLGFWSVNHFTALMKKKNDKWEVETSYWDGVVN